MAADKRAIDFGKIKRYISNRTAEFYIETLTGPEKDEFKSIIEYIDNVTKTKYLSEEYDVNKIETIKNKLNDFAPTRQQLAIISAINKEKKEENIKVRKARSKRKPPQQPASEKKPFEKISKAFWDLKTFIEEEGKQLTSKEIEVIKKNLMILTNYTDTVLQERFKFEIQQALRQAEEIKTKIERLNTRIKKV